MKESVVSEQVYSMIYYQPHAHQSPAVSFPSWNPDGGVTQMLVKILPSVTSSLQVIAIDDQKIKMRISVTRMILLHGRISYTSIRIIHHH